LPGQIKPGPSYRHAHARKNHCRDGSDTPILLGMKRVAWVLLAVFCAALVQIQPAQGLTAKAKTCDCCHVPGACGMPDCCPPLAFASLASGSEQAVRLPRPAAQKAQSLHSPSAKFYASFVEPAALRLALPPSAKLAAAARVPLFKAQCCFLI